MDTISNQAVKVDELDDLFADIGLLVEPEKAGVDEVHETCVALHQAIKLLLVAGKLDRSDLARAVELAEALQ